MFTDIMTYIAKGIPAAIDYIIGVMFSWMSSELQIFFTLIRSVLSMAGVTVPTAVPEPMVKFTRCLCTIIDPVFPFSTLITILLMLIVLFTLLQVVNLAIRLVLYIVHLL